MRFAGMPCRLSYGEIPKAAVPLTTSCGRLRTELEKCMGPLVFLFCYFLVAIGIGVLGARSRQFWARLSAVLAAASLPFLLWLMLGVRDALRFGDPVFDRETESGRFWFYAGSQLAFIATPIWLLAGVVGLWIGGRR